jgi:hypothetical protein
MTIITPTATAILRASILGTLAFKTGRKAIPAQDKDMMDLIAANEGCAIPLMKAYHKAWTSANLAI